MGGKPEEDVNDNCNMHMDGLDAPAVHRTCNFRDGCLMGDTERNQPALNVALEICGWSSSLTLSFSHFHGI